MSSIKAIKAVGKLGDDLRMARLRRGMSLADLAERVGASERSMQRLEKGDMGVRIGLLAEVMAVLGAIERVADLSDWRNDDIGQAKAQEKLPKRGRSLRRGTGRGPSHKTPPSGPSDPDGMGF